MGVAGTMSGVGREMPRYSCHKEVWALKIAKIDSLPGGGAAITPSDDGYTAFTVEPEYIKKHAPKVGGYFVVYKDGYKSWSPAEAFEDGYTRIK